MEGMEEKKISIELSREELDVVLFALLKYRDRLYEAGGLCHDDATRKLLDADAREVTRLYGRLCDTIKEVE